MEKCIEHRSGFLGLFKTFDHDFEAIFNIETGRPTVSKLSPLQCYEEDFDTMLNHQLNIIEASKSKKETYIHSQCSRCGLKINEITSDVKSPSVQENHQESIGTIEV